MFYTDYSEEPKAIDIDMQRFQDAQDARLYADAVRKFNKEHKQKMLCIKCLGVVGENCDCVAVAVPVVPINVIRLDDLFNADKRLIEHVTANKMGLPELVEA